MGLFSRECAMIGERRYGLVAIMSVVSLSALAQAQWTPPYWTIERIGLYDEDHTIGGAWQRSDAIDVNAHGRVIGHSLRSTTHNGQWTGQSAWTWSPSSGTIDIGIPR